MTSGSGHKALASSSSSSSFSSSSGGEVGASAAASKRETLWQEFFSDPSQWWDGRSEKVNPMYSDFKHKKMGEALWLVDNRNPSWVVAELAAIAPGTIHLDTFSWNRKLARYVKTGQHEKTLELFQHMQQQKGTSPPDSFAFVQVLNSCASLGALEEGRRVHAQIVANGCEANVFVGSRLVDMYARCGCMEDACRVFTRIPSRGVVTWNAMIF
jgi:pentatricopeptide repeat protein